MNQRQTKNQKIWDDIRIGHDGDFYAEMHQIFAASTEGRVKARILALCWEHSRANGSYANLIGFWPDFPLEVRFHFGPDRSMIVVDGGWRRGQQ